MHCLFSPSLTVIQCWHTMLPDCPNPSQQRDWASTSPAPTSHGTRREHAFRFLFQGTPSNGRSSLMKLTTYLLPDLLNPNYCQAVASKLLFLSLSSRSYQKHSLQIQKICYPVMMVRCHAAPLWNVFILPAPIPGLFLYVLVGRLSYRPLLIPSSNTWLTLLANHWQLFPLSCCCAR